MEFLKSRIFRFVASVGLAAIFYFICPPCFSQTYLGCVLGLLVIIINFNTFFARFRWLTTCTRILVGGLFIFSGFIKANDPVGFSIKLEEYFEVFGQGFSCDMIQTNEDGKSGLNIPCKKEKHQAKEVKVSASIIKPMYDFLGKHSILLAIIICGLEMALGVLLLMGIKVRMTLLLLLSMILFFSFLTFYSACCNKVTSCGCFGDAIKLTPWESFWKDLILLILIAIIFVGQENIKLLFRNRILLVGIAGLGLFASFAFPIYTYRHLPLIDFRPYAIGTNLWDATHQKDPKVTGCKRDSTVNEWYMYHGTDSMGPYKMFTLKNYPDSTWKLYCRYDKKLRVSSCDPTIMDFSISNPETGEPMNDSLLKRSGIQFFLIIYDIDKADLAAMGKINLFYDACLKNKTPFNGLSNASNERVEKYRVETGAKYPMLNVDGTALKTAIRSNPGLLMLKDGVVTAMWHANDFPIYSEVITKYK